jgi:WD40 repeat protein
MGDRRDPSRRASQKRSKKAAAQEAEEISIAASLVKMRFNGRSLFKLQHTQSVNCVIFSPDRQMLYGIAAANKVVMWDFTTGVKRELCVVIGGLPLAAIACSHDGKYIAGSILRGGYVVWDAVSGEQVARFHARGIPALRFSPDSNTLATAGRSGEINFWGIPELLKCGNRTPYPVHGE